MSIKFLVPASALAAVVLASSLFSYRDGALPGISFGLPFGTVPGDATRQADSCGNCHVLAPERPRPQVSLAPSARILTPGESISMTTSATGGVVDPEPERNAGGFATDATDGTFTAGSNSQVDAGSTKVTHQWSFLSNNRTWTYGYTAPNAPGLVEVFTVVNTVNGNDSWTGDAYAFHGADPTDTVSTPVRLYVVPTGVEFSGAGCPDGFGNHSVLGSTEVPSVGNQSFGLEIHGASTDQLCVLVGGFNPPGFQPIDLGLSGAFGCSAYVFNPIVVTAITTTTGEARRGEGSGFFPFPIPNKPIFQGKAVALQAAYVDPSASMLGRFLTISVTNGLRIVVQ